MVVFFRQLAAALTRRLHAVLNEPARDLNGDRTLAKRATFAVGFRAPAVAGGSAYVVRTDSA